MSGPSSDTTALIRQARAKFLAMAITYALGVFNDNFYKQAVLLLAVAAGHTQMQGYALVVFTLPFMLFAAPAGWFADRYPKGAVVIGSKWLEVAAMVFGALGICLDTAWLTFLMLFTMAAQSTLFSPALNGSIPELYPEDYVIRANAVLRVFVTVAILAGIALAGVGLDVRGEPVLGIGRGRLVVGIGVVAVALAGVAMSYGVAHRPAAAPGKPFPWRGPLDTLRDLGRLRADPLLRLTAAASVFIWFLGSLEVLLLNPLGLRQVGLSGTATSGLIATQLVGVAAGGVLSTRLARGVRWHRVLLPAGLAIAVPMLFFPLVPRLPATMLHTALFGLTGTVGVAGGLFLIPVESFIQVRPPADRRGATLAAVNFACFAGMLVSGLISNVLNATCQPTTSFGLLGGFTVPAVLGLAWAYRKHEGRP